MTDFLFALPGHGWTLLSYIVPFFFVLALVIFIHELGHFLVGRLCGVGVDAFAIGFGPKVFGWRDSHGTEWKLAAIPLGGYVKFRGDLNAASMPDNDTAARMTEAERSEAFQFKPLWKRAAIVAAGPLANFALSIAIFTGMFMFSGQYIVEPIVGSIVQGAPADEAGFKLGDRVITIDGLAIDSFDSIRRAIATSPDKPLDIEVLRSGVVRKLVAMPRVTEQRTPFGILRSKTIGLGSSVNPDHHSMVKYGLVDSVVLAVEQIKTILGDTVSYVGGLIAGREKADQLSGPIRIAQVSGKVAEAGFGPLITLAAILSASIGFVNLLPVPVLDGGHLMFYAIEALFRRPLNRKAQELLFRVGLGLILMLMVFVTVNDIIQIGQG